MNLSKYSTYDGLGLAGLIRSGEVTARELACLALDGIEKVNPRLNAVVEIFQDRVDDLADGDLPEGPFKGVPLVLKDLGPTIQGRRQTSGSNSFAHIWIASLSVAGSTEASHGTKRGRVIHPGRISRSLSRPIVASLLRRPTGKLVHQAAIVPRSGMFFQEPAQSVQWHWRSLAPLVFVAPDADTPSSETAMKAHAPNDWVLAGRW